MTFLKYAPWDALLMEEKMHKNNINIHTARSD